MNKIEFNTHIKAPINRCFDLARSVDFHKISTTSVKLKTVAGCTSGLLGPDQHVLIQSTLGVLRFNTELKIAKFNPPFFFSYEIVDRLFESILHDYYFYDISEETVMVSHFYFKTKWGILGEMLRFLFLENFLRRTISNRNEMLRNYAETEKWKDLLPNPKLKYQSFAKK